jgi:hypothetical protein
MTQYTLKSTTVDVAQWDGKDFAAIQMVTAPGRKDGVPPASLGNGELTVITDDSPEGVLVPAGWWVGMRNGHVAVWTPTAWEDQRDAG